MMNRLRVCFTALLLFGQLSVASAENRNINPVSDALKNPPGQRIDVGGYKLHINCQGEGRPVVILDAGVGGFSLEWQAVQTSLARQTRVCAYDRAGYGWSDMGPLPRTTAQAAEELHALLSKAPIKAPFILVGHSFGGYVAQYFARTWSEEMAGLVLVDSSHPEQVERLPKTDKQRRAANAPGGRSVYIMQQMQVHPNYPEARAVLALRLIQTWKTALTIREELLNYSLSARQLREAGNLPDMPLVVLTRGRRVWPYTEQGDALESTWMTLQDELANMLPNAVHLIAEDAGHSIHMDKPGVVISAVTTMLNRMDKQTLAGR